MEVPPEEREAFWEKLYGEPGFGIWLSNFRDTGVDEKANAAISDFIARKIRQCVKDPKMAEQLIPKDHGFGTRRVPLESGYFEAYNRDNVTLVDTLTDEPIECINPKGIKTSQQEYEFDVLIYATGFDGVAGAFDRIDICARHEWSAAEGLLGRKPAAIFRRPLNTACNFRPACCGSCRSITTRM